MQGSQIIGLTQRAPRIGDRCFIASGAVVVGDVVIGEDCSLWFNAVVRGDCYYVRIGKESNIQDGTIVHVTSGRFPTIIGERVTIGHQAMLHGCTIESGCLVGMAAVLMDACVIGEQSLVAAGSLVPPGKKYPPRHLIKGTPAKAVRPLEPAELTSLDEAADHYLNYKAEYYSLCHVEGS